MLYQLSVQLSNLSPSGGEKLGTWDTLICVAAFFVPVYLVFCVLYIFRWAVRALTTL